MAKAIKLNMTPDFDFNLIGIVSSEPIYRIAWLLNQELGLNLVEHTPIKLCHPKTNAEQKFALLTYADEEQGKFYDLVQNKGVNGLLIEEQKQVDFLLKVNDELRDAAELIRRIKPIKGINLAFAIEPGLLKSKNRLIWDY